MQQVKALIPNLLTAGNLIGGILAIVFSLTGRLEWAPYCIFISAFLDFFDGFAARLLKVQSELGKQLDSLADMVTFGVAPGIIVFMLLKTVAMLNILELLKSSENSKIFMNSCHFPKDSYAENSSNLQELVLGTHSSNIKGISEMNTVILQFDFLPYIALLIPVFSMFRLAKFNLDTRQTNSFIGVPTPANTIFFAAIPLCISNLHVGFIDSLNIPMRMLFLSPWFYIISVPIMSYLLIAELPLFALKFKSFGWKGNEIRYSFLTAAAVLLATLQWLAIPLIIILYILLSLIQNLNKR